MGKKVWLAVAVLGFVLLQSVRLWAASQEIMAVSTASDIRFSLMKSVIENSYPDIKVVRGGQHVSSSAKLLIEGSGGSGETVLSKGLVRELDQQRRQGKNITVYDICEDQRNTVVYARGKMRAQNERPRRVVVVREAAAISIPVYVQPVYSVPAYYPYGIGAAYPYRNYGHGGYRGYGRVIGYGAVHRGGRY